MKFLERLDRLVRPIAIPNLTMVIIIGQVAMFLLAAGDPSLLSRASLVMDRVLEGEVWRLVTFMIVPPTTNVIFLLFALYIFYLMGTALEQTWGNVRYNVFFYLGYVLTLIGAAIAHSQPVSAAFLQGSVFLAFATYNPRFQLMLFFILPIQIRWLAYLQALGYGLAFFGGGLATKLTVVASLGNYLIFFAPMVFHRVKNLKRRVAWEARQAKQDNIPRHTCAVCGVNSDTHPDMDFRYCSKCDGERAYCQEHLRNHEHVREG